METLVEQVVSLSNVAVMGIIIALATVIVIAVLAFASLASYLRTMVEIAKSVAEATMAAAASQPKSNGTLITIDQPAAKPSAAVGIPRPEPPGISCGHCGARIKTPPVRGIELEPGVPLLARKCDKCGKETLLPA